MKKGAKKDFITVKTLKKEVKKYIKLKKAEKYANGANEYFAVNNLFESLDITLEYVRQMDKQEFDVIILYAMKLINKFQSEELACSFIWKYEDLYANGSKAEQIYKDTILCIYQYIESSPNYNRLNFTKEMKEVMRGWKGKTLQSYIENADDGYITAIRLCVENQAFDIDNGYIPYWHSRDNIEELTCFSCTEVVNGYALQSASIGGKSRENAVGEKIIDIYIVKDIKKEKLFDLSIPYELEFETAIIIQTEKRYYVFWRDLIFYTIKVATCGNMEGALKVIKSVSEIQAEAQEENPYAVIVERRIEKI